MFNHLTHVALRCTPTRLWHLPVSGVAKCLGSSRQLLSYNEPDYRTRPPTSRHGTGSPIHGPGLELSPCAYSCTWLSRTCVFNTRTAGNAWAHTQHCSYWCPGAQAPGHQNPQCRLNIYCIGPVLHRIITVIEESIKTYILKIIPSSLSVKPLFYGLFNS